MELKRAAQLQDRFQVERDSGSPLTGPRYGSIGGSGAGREMAALQTADSIFTTGSIQSFATGQVGFILGYSRLGDGSKLI